MDWSISDISWLHQPNPGEYALHAAQVGQGAARNFMDAMMRSQENARENAMQPLKQQEMQMQIQSHALDIHAKQELMADDIANKGAFSELSTAAADISQRGAWADPKSEALIWNIGARNPAVMKRLEFQNIIKQFDTAGAAAIKAKDAETRAQKATEGYDVAQQRIALGQEKLTSEEKRATEAVTSKEKIATEANQTKLEVAHVAAENRALGKGFDLLDHSLQARYVQQVKWIFDKENADFKDKPAAARERAAMAAHKRLMEESVEGKKAALGNSASAPAASDNAGLPQDRGQQDMSPMIQPAQNMEGKIGTDRKTGKRYRITNGVPVLIK